MSVRAAPVVFVVLWSTGFVVARYATEDNGPIAFLTVRLLIAGVVLGAIALIQGATWPAPRQIGTSAWAGLGLHAAYLGGVFVAIDLGMSPGLSALISGLHPVVTSVFSRLFLGERLIGRQWFGVLLGLAGVVWFTTDRLVDTEVDLPAGALIAMGVSLTGVVTGTLVQRRWNGGIDLLPGTSIHYLASGAVLGIIAIAAERQPLVVTTRFALALLWAVVVLSFVSVLLMLWLLRQQAASSVSSLFFLTPALSAIEAAVLFGDPLDAVAVVSLAIAAIGVLLVVRSPGSPAGARGRRKETAGHPQIGVSGRNPRGGGE